MKKDDLKILIILLLIAALIATLTGLYIKYEVIQKNYLYKIFSPESAAGFDVSKLGNDKEEQRIKYGYELISNTAKYLGSGAKEGMHYAGNELSCKSCHLQAGKKAFSMPFIGVSGRFPQLLGRENKIETLQERINGCMERSMNGKALPDGSEEMRAMVAYMDWLSRDVPKNYNLNGKGFMKIQIPNRAVDLKKGKMIYQNNCASCHGVNGEGEDPNNIYGSFCPPLWGKNSYNIGSGMARVLTAADFIKGNMPFENSSLSDEEAFDVAGYINSFERPKKSDLNKDYPNLKLKPLSSPYPPYFDKFPNRQHKVGPYPPMIDFYKEQLGIEKDK